MRYTSWFVLSALGVAGCNKGETLETGADLLQGAGPIREIDILVNGFHYASGDMSLQEEANHYCHRQNDHLIQCVLYDSTEKGANMIGIEHIVSRQAFNSLPDEEKVLWHPHTYEVKSGALIAPGLPMAAEHALMEELISTYGKTWHVWHPSEHQHPMDTATLMKAFTEDGQLDPELLRRRDERFGIDSAERRANRADIENPGFDPIVLMEPDVCPSIEGGLGGG